MTHRVHGHCAPRIPLLGTARSGGPAGTRLMAEESTARRKDAHLDLAATGDVEPAGNRTLLDCVHLIHCAMPELAVEDVETTTPFLGKTLKHPLIITGMTGG